MIKITRHVTWQRCCDPVWCGLGTGTVYLGKPLKMKVSKPQIPGSAQESRMGQRIFLFFFKFFENFI